MTSRSASRYGASELEHSLTEALLLRNQRPVDDASRRRAVLHWLDWVGCVAAGARAPVATVLRDWNMRPGVKRTCPALLGMANDPYHAMLLDAGPANVEEMDDMHRQAILHPGPVIIPALAALARDRTLAASQVLDALVRGYEVMIRIGRAVGRRHYYYWHNTATAGAFGAAAACADVLGLPMPRAVWALGNAGTQAAGLWQVRLEPVMSKQLHTGHAAWAGMTAASLAEAGFSGPTRILEGERGFFAAMCDGAEASAVLRDECNWLIHETSFKPWPACRHSHATIDCLLALREQQGDGPLHFTECIVETFNDALSICDNPNPESRTEAKFSLQYCAAAAAEFGPLRPENFDASCFEREDLRANASRVSLKQASDIEARYPNHYGARVTLRLVDGRTCSHEVRDSLGDPERALGESAVIEKARTLMNYGGVRQARAAQALSAAAGLLKEDEGTNTRMAAPFPAALLQPLF